MDKLGTIIIIMKKKPNKNIKLEIPDEKLSLQREIEVHQEGWSSIVELVDKQETSELLLMNVWVRQICKNNFVRKKT